VAIDALIAGRGCHSFLGIDTDGNTCVINTTGNPWGHLILRGGRSGPNYSAEHLKAAAVRLKEAGASPSLVVDCSHANSDKDYRRQHVAWNDVVDQRVAGNRAIVGLMLESNIHPGSQKLTGNRADLKEGVSITDGCIGWEETESLILSAHRRLKDAAT
jgi:3-deoxy-7-phosphoheptulonate synthase